MVSTRLCSPSDFLMNCCEDRSIKMLTDSKSLTQYITLYFIFTSETFLSPLLSKTSRLDLFRYQNLIK